MELRHLQAFVAAGQSESFTQAAAQLGITQAAISQQVAALEKEFGTSFFQRHGRGVRLNGHGRQFFEYAQRILNLVDEATRQMSRTEDVVSGVLRIATSTVPAEWLLPRLLAEFRQQCPQVRESLRVSDSRLAAQEVEAGEADVGFVGEIPKSPQLEAHPVAADELVLFVAADHPLAGKKYTTLKRLCREPLIIREAGSASRGCVERALEEHGLTPSELTIALETNNNDAIRAAVERGIGAAFLSRRANAQQAGLSPVKVRGFHPRRQLYVIRHARRAPTPAAHQFLTFVDQWRSSKSARMDD